MDDYTKELYKGLILNRQPTLFRHGIAYLRVVPAEDPEDETIGINPLTLEPFNADFDGDTCALYAIHDYEALEELQEKAYVMNTLEYDTDGSMLAVMRHELLYASFILTENVIPREEENPIIIKELNDLPESIDLYNDYLDGPVLLNDQLYSYGVCLINKWTGINKIFINVTINKKQNDNLSRSIYNHFKDNKKYYDSLSELSKQLSMFISITNHSPSININEMLSILDTENEKLFKKLPSKNIILGYHINEALIDRCISNFDTTTQLYKLFKSGSRFNKQQLSRSCINTGYIADDKNIINISPIKTNLMKGMTEGDFQLSVPGTRKGIADKSQFVPRSGYMERTMTMALSPLEIMEEDCGTTNYLEILVFSEKHAKTLVDKYFQDIHTLTPEIWEVMKIEDIKKYINTKIRIRSPITCIVPKFKMCRKCYGLKKANTEYLGVMAGQIISERITQLIMRSFHTSGSATLNSVSAIVDFFADTLINIEEDTMNKVTLHFNEDVPLSLLSTLATIPGYDHTHNAPTHLNYHPRQLKFNPFEDVIQNKDAISIMEDIGLLLKKKSKGDINPVDYYETMMSKILEVGTPYSSYVEMFFANTFFSESGLWRYTPTEKVILKLGDKEIAKKISPLLGLLFQPNKQSIEDIGQFEELDLEVEASENIYGKIWACSFDE